MADALSAEPAPPGADERPVRDNLRFHRHPYAPLRFAAYDDKRVRVEGDDAWGEFTRDGVWLEGPLRHADPIFCRWVCSERIYNERIAKAKDRA
jgi:hypothetical protein